MSELEAVDIKAKLGAVKDRSKYLTKELAHNKALKKDYQHLMDYCNTAIGSRLEEVKAKIEPIVNEALKIVFKSDNLVFTLRTTIKADKTQYYPLIINKTTGVEGLREEHGGGVVTLVSVLLRMIFIMLQDNLMRFIVLDESLNPVSPAYRNKVSEFLAKVCRELDFTVVLITFDEYQGFSSNADNVYEAVKSEKGIGTRFKKIKR